MKNISNSTQFYRSHYYHDLFELYFLKGIIGTRKSKTN